MNKKIKIIVLTMILLLLTACGSVVKEDGDGHTADLAVVENNENENNNQADILQNEKPDEMTTEADGEKVSAEETTTEEAAPEEKGSTTEAEKADKAASSTQKEAASTKKENTTMTSTKKETTTTQSTEKEETSSAESTTAKETTEKEEETTTVDWVAELAVAQKTDQLIVVAASGSSATVSMHNKDNEGNWSEIMSTTAAIGKNGIGKTSEGDKKTPTGQYKFTLGFGIKANPGTAFSYTQVDDTYYWVDDVNSQYYNQFVSTNEVEQDWTFAEHIASSGSVYNYALAINYNTSCTPGAGSAIFMHCKKASTTNGCIAVPESDMLKIMQNVKPNCILIIDSAANVYNY